MNQILSFFAKLDTFSVPFTQTIGINNQYVFYKSAFGGMITIIILTFAIIYSIDELYTWGSGNMIYRVSSQRKNGFNEQNEEFDIFQKNTHYENYIEFQIMSNNDSMFEPFYSDQAIILPLMINQQSLEVQSLLENFDLENGLLYANMENFESNDFLIIFVNCIGNEQYLLENQKCANQSLVDQFYQEKGLEIQTFLFSEKMDYSIDEKYDLYSTISIPIEQQSAASIDVFFEYEVLNIKNGLLFQENEKHILNSDYSSQTQFISSQYLTNYMEYYIPVKSVFFAIWISKDYNYIETWVQYPSISEALANIASIIQTLLLIRYFINWINRTQMYENLKVSLANLYYPELKQIIKKQIGKQEKYFLNDQEIEKSSYKKFKQSLYQMLNRKFDYFNMMTEIFQMQRLLYNMCSQFQIKGIANSSKESIFLAKQEDNLFKILNFCYTENEKKSQRFDPFFFSQEISNKQQKETEILLIDSKKDFICTSKIEKYQEFKKKSQSDYQIVY